MQAAAFISLFVVCTIVLMLMDQGRRRSGPRSHSDNDGGFFDLSSDDGDGGDD